ncbi:MAG: ABC transporter permease [Rhodovulum sp.]|nr:ABC transporter permease [Rhodovulum sp.]
MGRRDRRIRRLTDAALGAVLPLLLLAAWEIATRFALVSSFLLPRPGAVVVRLAEEIAAGTLPAAAGATLLRLTVSYGIAAVVGVGLGIAMARLRTVRWVLDPVVSIALPSPKISLLPILVLWFGVFDTPKIVIGVLSCVFPIVAGTAAGAAGVDRHLIWSAENLGTRPGALLWRVVLPAALPQIVTALQVALPIAFIAVVVAEMLTGGGGLGGGLIEATRLADPAGAFAHLVAIGVLGFLAMAALRRLRRFILVWHEEEQRQGVII